MILDMDQDRDRVPEGVPAGGGTAQPHGRPLPAALGRPGHGLGRHLHGDGGGRDRSATSSPASSASGAELVCDAIVLHGTDAQRERYVKPLLRGEIFAAECLTEPRGGSDFFGTTTVAEDRGRSLPPQRPEALHRRRGGRPTTSSSTPGPIPTAPAARGDHRACSSTAAPASRPSYLYGLMGCRGGGAGADRLQGRASCRRRTSLGRLHGGGDGLRHHDDPRAARHRRDDHRRGAPGARDRHRATRRKRKAFGQTIQPLPGRELPGRRGGHAARRLARDGLHTSRGRRRGVAPGRVRRMVSRDEEVRHRVVPEGGARTPCR